MKSPTSTTVIIRITRLVVVIPLTLIFSIELATPVYKSFGLFFKSFSLYNPHAYPGSTHKQDRGNAREYHRTDPSEPPNNY